MPKKKVTSPEKSDDDLEPKTDLNCEPNLEITESQYEESSDEEQPAETPQNKDDVGKKNKANKKENQRTIFIGNLHHNIQKRQLLKLFSKFGEIEKINYGASAHERSFRKRKQMSNKVKPSITAYIRFADSESAREALSVDGKLIKNHNIRVDTVVQSKFSKHKGVFLTNLPKDISEEKLRGLFDKCGEISSVRVIRDRNTLLCKGIGFVNFKNKDAVVNALKMNKGELKKSVIRVNEIDCNWHKKKKETLKHAEDVNSAVDKIKPKRRKIKQTEKSTKKKTFTSKGKKMAFLKEILNKSSKKA